jgi:CDP-diacylglycerol---serine O-phosphatidyltransferase
MELNDVNPIGHEQEQEFPRTIRNSRLRRGVYILPSAFTVANMLCGYYAILATLDGKISDFENAALAIGFAYVFDSVDGRIARMMGTESAFGREFDSLADIVSFGLAPALLAYAWGVRTLGAANAPEWLHLTQLGWLIGFIFVASCAWRLARFNIQGMAPGGNKYFVGMPTPAAAGMLAATVYYFHGTPISDIRVSILWLALMVVLSVLMSSTLRFFSFKDIPLTRKQPSLAVILLALLAASVFSFSHQMLFIITACYTLHAPILQIFRHFRLRSRPA